MRLKKAWYIFLYHNVDWQLSPFLWNMKGSIAPDIFSEHLSYLHSLGEFVSIDEGFSALKNKSIKAPLISFWFDDFYTGVRTFAKPILDEYSTTAAISINSASTNREKYFWRSQLCFIRYKGLIPKLISQLRNAGISIRASQVKSDTMQHFSIKMLHILDDVFSEALGNSSTDIPFSIFDDVESMKWMYEEGWTISNHSAHHYPITEDSAFHLISDEFDFCGAFLTEHLGKDSPFLVLPFDRTHFETTEFNSWANSQTDKVVVRVGDKPNFEFNAPYLYRINTPTGSLSELQNHLKSINRG